MGFALLDAQGNALPSKDTPAHPMQLLALQLVRGVASLPEFDTEIQAVAGRVGDLTPEQAPVVECLQLARDMRAACAAFLGREEKRRAES